MPKLKININNIKERIGRIPRLLGENAFAAFIIFFALSCVFGIVVFYSYAVLPEKTTVTNTEKQLQFELGPYGKVLDTWANNEQHSQETKSTAYLNLFSPK